MARCNDESPAGEGKYRFADGQSTPCLLSFAVLKFDLWEDPGFNAIALLQAVKKNPATRLLPVIGNDDRWREQTVTLLLSAWSCLRYKDLH